MDLNMPNYFNVCKKIPNNLNEKSIFGCPHHFPKSNIACQYFKISKIQSFGFPRFNRIYFDSKLIQNYSRFQRFDGDCKMLRSQTFKYWPSGFFDTQSFQHFQAFYSQISRSAKIALLEWLLFFLCFLKYFCNR